MSMLQKARMFRNVFKGLTAFDKQGVTPEFAYQSLIQLHCMTRGRATDWLHGFVSRGHKPAPLASKTGALGQLDESRIAIIVDQINRDGYYVFDEPLAADKCDAIEAFARSHEAQLKPRRAGLPAAAVYDTEWPLAEVYNFREQDSITCPAIQELAADMSFLAVAQRYLAVEPILDLVAMWWSSKYGQEASSEAAQLYHFDMDRIKWIKFFVYLTDVTSDTGPHCYVTGSHRPSGAPAELLKRGYVRIPDEDMHKAFRPEQFVEITGKRGTIIAVDTRGFHKGKPPLAGERLILQLEYCDSLFGTTYTRTKLPDQVSPELQSLFRDHPRLFSKFTN